MSTCFIHSGDVQLVKGDRLTCTRIWFVGSGVEVGKRAILLSVVFKEKGKAYLFQTPSGSPPIYMLEHTTTLPD